MKILVYLLYFIISFKKSVFCNVETEPNFGKQAIYLNAQPAEDLKDLFMKIIDKLTLTEKLNCIGIITDDVYLNIFQETIFRKIKNIPYVMITVKDSEDLLSPNYDTLESVRLVRKQGCELYVIFLANGLQLSRFLRFGEKYRVLNTRSMYILIHDFRLFNRKTFYIWKRIINVIFIRHFIDNGSESSFELSTVPYPSPIKDVVLPKRIEIWKKNQHLKTQSFFIDKTLNLKGHTLNVVALEHVPAVVKMNATFNGIEIMIVQTISKAMEFIPIFYEPKNAKREQWGRKYRNGSFTGLLGEIVLGKSDVALGNLHYTPYHLQLTDLSIPYISQCLTFLTPESLTDNSWKTLILPFKLYMWIAVLIVLFLSGFIFHGLAKFHKNLSTMNNTQNKVNEKPKGLYLFEELTNSILYTYGMLLVVSLPKLPPAWSIRLLTGWYWLYCVLVVVSYRASMTAILANPTPRVTIDTMEQLTESSIMCGGWGEQTKQFFLSSLDETGKKIGYKYKEINNAEDGVDQVAKGKLAYYGNTFFLKYISMIQKNKNVNDKQNKNQNVTDLTLMKGDRNLHVMKDCAIHMPISIGLQKNSPLKSKVDKLIRKIIEAGLIEKWLNDIMTPIFAITLYDGENTKALMNLQKLYAGFIALAIGYFMSLVCLISEIIHWNYIVKKDPHFDIYALDVYYSKKKLKK